MINFYKKDLIEFIIVVQQLLLEFIKSILQQASYFYDRVVINENSFITSLFTYHEL